jgi:1,4-dihydroxy-2-naphthoate octaprenyltransferase
MTRVQTWWLATRPKTLSIAVVPVLVGTCLAWSERGAIEPLVALAALLAAVLIQAGTNLYNDAVDFERGVDTAHRAGPRRVTAQGWLSPRQVKRGAHLSFAVALLLGVFLVWVGGWPILVVGLLSIAAGYAYTGGPMPLAYTGLGELFVWLFFGVAAVMGSYYLQLHTLGWGAFAAGAAVGLLATAVLVVNNYRDLESDRTSGKHTLAVRLGPAATRAEYASLLGGAFLLLFALRGTDEWVLLPWLLLPWVLRLLWRFYREPIGPVFNQLLARTAQLQLAYGLLLSLGLLL